MNINTAVGEIRTHYLNLPKDDLTEGGRFTAEVLEKLVADERKKVLSEVEDLLMDETLISYASWRRSTRKYGGTQEEYERLDDILNNQNQLRAELRAKVQEMKEGK